METNNVKKMREALKLCTDTLKKVNAVLSAPPRNCDVGTIDEQQKRFGKLCSQYPDCKGCAIQGLKKRGDNCELIWAQMKYEAR